MGALRGEPLSVMFGEPWMLAPKFICFVTSLPVQLMWILQQSGSKRTVLLGTKLIYNLYPFLFQLRATLKGAVFISAHDSHQKRPAAASTATTVQRRRSVSKVV